MPHTIPAMPYGYDALEPHIDARTMEIHYTKHHQGYVNKLNAALERHAKLQKLSLEDLLGDLTAVPEEIRTAVRNNGGGHANHSLFWQIMVPGAGGEPEGDLRQELDATFGAFAKFRDRFTEAATSRFGSGWAWLVLTPDGLAVESTPNQDSPLMQHHLPLLGLDVWEHAYYLKYQNRRADYIKAWWNVVNWPDVARRFEAARATEHAGAGR
jgi:Fe-Mn family superoxide dismutase